MFRSSLIALAVCLAATALSGGCTPFCDTLPSESAASVRILNAVSDAKKLTIYVDGKPFDSSAHAHISSTLVRLAARVGLNRVPKNVTPSLHDYLESKVAETEVAE